MSIVLTSRVRQKIGRNSSNHVHSAQHNAHGDVTRTGNNQIRCSKRTELADGHTRRVAHGTHFGRVQFRGGHPGSVLKMQRRAKFCCKISNISHVNVRRWNVRTYRSSEGANTCHEAHHHHGSDTGLKTHQKHRKPSQQVKEGLRLHATEAVDA